MSTEKVKFIRQIGQINWVIVDAGTYSAFFYHFSLCVFYTYNKYTYDKANLFMDVEYLFRKARLIDLAFP